jgi:hypothetical protein
LDNTSNKKIMQKEEVIEKLRIRKEPITYFGESDQDRLNRLLVLEKELPLDYETGQELEKKDENLEKKKEEIKLEEERLEKEALDNMTDQQKKIFNLALKLNHCRKKNLESVEEELKLERIQKKNPHTSKRKQREQEADLSITAEYAEKIENKKKKKENKHQPFGWEIFNSGLNFFQFLKFSQDTLYNSHEKRSKEIPYSKEEYQLTKEKKEENEEYEIDEIPEENKNRMARELEKKIKKGAKFSRRRTFNEDDDVTFINETNRVFNKKISRAYDQYTNDIKNNLERGTSL